MEILLAVFDWISKQQLNLLLFLLDPRCRKLGLTGLPGHNVKVTSDEKMISGSHQRGKSGSRGYWSHFTVTFERKGKVSTFFVRLILGKKGADGVTTGNWHQI